MFVLLSELTLFLSIIWVVTYSFTGQQEVSDIDKVEIKRVLNDVVWSDYKSLTVDSKIDKDKQYIYKEYIVEYNEWELDTDLCNQITN